MPQDAPVSVCWSNSESWSSADLMHLFLCQHPCCSLTSDSLSGGSLAGERTSVIQRLASHGLTMLSASSCCYVTKYLKMQWLNSCWFSLQSSILSEIWWRKAQRLSSAHCSISWLKNMRYVMSYLPSCQVGAGWRLDTVSELRAGSFVLHNVSPSEQATLVASQHGGWVPRLSDL